MTREPKKKKCYQRLLKGSFGNSIYILVFKIVKKCILNAHSNLEARVFGICVFKKKKSVFCVVNIIWVHVLQNNDSNAT